MTKEQLAAWEIIKPLCAEAQYIEKGSCQGGDEDFYVKGIKRGSTVFVFCPDAKPYKDTI